MRCRALAIVAVLGLMTTLSAAAQPAPASGIVTLMVPYGPGTGGDIMARQIAPLLSEKWDRPVVVENRPGASGIIGTEAVARAAPDGNTLLLAINTLTMIPSLYKRLPFDIFKDFAPVTKIGTSSFGLVVNTNIAAQNLPALLTYAREHPEKLHYASPGNGTPHHLAMELLKLGSKVDIAHVPYKSLGAALTDTIGGHVDLMFSAVPSLLPHVAAGRLRLLATTGEKRSPLTPNTPTFLELGLEHMKGVDAWFAILAPRGTPAVTIEKLHRDITAVVTSAALVKQLGSQGISVETSSPEELGALMKADFARWKSVIDASGIQID